MPLDLRIVALTYPVAWLVLIVIFIVVLLRSKPASDEAAFYIFGFAFCLAGPLLCQMFVNHLSNEFPLKYDLYIDRIDRTLGDPSWRIGLVLVKHRWLFEISAAAYGLIAPAELGVFWAYASKVPVAVPRVAKALLLNLFLAVPFYALAPAAGPRYAFPGFPFNRPNGIAAHPIPLSAPPNCIPSVHFSTALLILFFCWRWRWARVPATVYCLLIVLSTLGSGEHYAFDLICAIPYTAVVLAISKMRLRRAHLPSQ